MPSQLSTTTGTPPSVACEWASFKEDQELGTVILHSPTQMVEEVEALRQKNHDLAMHNNLLQQELDTLRAEVSDCPGFHEGMEGFNQLTKQLLSKTRQWLIDALTCDGCLCQTHHPYTLVPCGHSFCSMCLSTSFRQQSSLDLHTSDNWISRLWPSSRVSLTCPFCLSPVEREPLAVQHLIKLAEQTQDLSEMADVDKAGDNQTFETLFRR